jgi:hypothetical protein
MSTMETMQPAGVLAVERARQWFMPAQCRPCGHPPSNAMAERIEEKPHKAAVVPLDHFPFDNS